MAEASPLNPEVTPRRAVQVLSAAAVLVAVLAAVFVVFILPAFAVSSMTIGSEGAAQLENNATRTIWQEYGVVAAIVALVPIAIAALPFVVPERLWRWVTLASAIVVTLGSFFSGITLGMFYAPLAVMLWAVALAPRRMEQGFGFANVTFWRIVAAIFVALPGFYLAVQTSSGAVTLSPLLTAVLGSTIVLGVALAFGLRLAALFVAAIGLAALVLTVLAPVGFMLATWWIGGLYLALGLTVFVAWGEKHEREERWARVRRR